MTKIIKNRDLINSSIEDLETSLLTYKKSLFEARFNRFLTDKSDTSLFKKYKKSIAKVKTKINQINQIKQSAN